MRAFRNERAPNAHSTERDHEPELKTEKGSHRAHHIPGYFELARHHYPHASIDLLHVTPPTLGVYEPAAAWARHAHTTWADLVPPIQSSSPSGSASGDCG